MQVEERAMEEERMREEEEEECVQVEGVGHHVEQKDQRRRTQWEGKDL